MRRATAEGADTVLPFHFVRPSTLSLCLKRGDRLIRAWDGLRRRSVLAARADAVRQEVR